MTALPEKRDAFASVRIREYRRLLTGRFLFIMGLRMITTIVGWWIYELTNDPFAIGLIGLSEVIPAVSLALYAGHVIDVSEKKKLLLIGVTLYFIAALLFFCLSSSLTKGYLSNHTISIFIYAIIFCTGIIRSFVGPVFHTFIASIVPRNILPNAITWNQGTWLSASVTGHATAGLSIAFMGISGALGIVICLMIVSFAVMSGLQRRPALNLSSEKKTWDSVKEGISFVLKTREVLGALTLDLFAVLFGGAVAMVPVFARDILRIGPKGFGFLNGASDLGSICIVILLTVFPLARKQGKKLFFAIFGFGSCIILFALSRWFWLSFSALLVAGMLDGVSVVIRGTILQLKTPDHMRGRVMSVNSMFINSSNELGQFESGVAAKLMGVVPSVVFGGCMTILVVVTTWLRAPSLRKMEY